MNFMYDVSVRVDGVETARVNQRRGKLEAGRQGQLLDLLVEGAESWDGAPQDFSAAEGSMIVTASEGSVRFLHKPTGLEFAVLSRPSARKDAADSHHLNLEFKRGLRTEGPDAARGALPQLWGTRDITPAVEAMVLGHGHGRGHELGRARGINQSNVTNSSLGSNQTGGININVTNVNSSSVQNQTSGINTNVTNVNPSSVQNQTGGINTNVTTVNSSSVQNQTSGINTSVTNVNSSPGPNQTGGNDINASMKGDPHVFFNGKVTSIHLPTDRFTRLLEQGGVSILARGGPEGAEHMNFLYDVSVRVDGVETARVNQRRGHLEAGRQGQLLDLRVEGAESWHGAPQEFSAAEGSMIVTASEGSVR